MKQMLWIAVCLGTTLLTSSCREHVLDTYVERIVPLEFDVTRAPNEARGTLTFYQVIAADEDMPESRTPVRSRIDATLHGASDWSGVIELVLGVRTTPAFIEAFDVPGRRPPGLESLWDWLERTDRTLLVLKAKGLRLAKGQRFLELPREFRRGDSVKLDVHVETVNTETREILSAIGASDSFPALEF